MDIQINHEATEYITRKSKDKSITIEVQERPGRSWIGSCGIPSYYPSVRWGKPKKIENYEQIENNGITVYFHSNLGDFFTQVIVKVEKIFFIRKLVASYKE